MTYRPALPSRTNPFLTAYNDTAQELSSVPADFNAHQFINCTEATTSGQAHVSTGAFFIGELRVEADGDYNLFDTGIEGGDVIISEGYQVRSNAAGTVCMDDACYGTSGTSAQIRVKALNKHAAGVADTSAEELRILGVRTS